METDELHFHDNFYASEAEPILGSPLFKQLRKRIIDDFSKRAILDARTEIVSLGCGSGEYEELLARQVGKITGYDISPVAVERAKKRCKQQSLGNAYFEVVDLTQTASDWPTNKVDAICAFGLLHHFEDDFVLALLRSARDLLKPQGVFYSIDPSARRLVNWFSPLFTSQINKFHTSNERQLIPEKLAQIFLNAGFVEASIAYCEFFLGPAAWLMPRCPARLVPILNMGDKLLVHTPGLRRYSSGFAILARNDAL